MAQREVEQLDKRRFFKIMFDKDDKFMYLPPMIAQDVKHLDGKVTEIVDKMGVRWPVTVSEINGSLAFAEGWKKFYSDHHLKKGEVLVFKYISGSHFVVNVFGHSACQRVNFSYEIPQSNKRAKKAPQTSSEEEPYSHGNPVSEVARTMPIEMEAIDCMMMTEYVCYQGENLNILGDLSVFENIKMLPNTNESRNVNRVLEQAKTIEDDVVMVEGHSDELLKPLPDIADEETKGDVTESQTAEINTEQVIEKGYATENVTDKFQKPVEVNTEQGIEKGDATESQTAEIHLSWTGEVHFKKPSENSNLIKETMNASKVQRGEVVKKEMMEMEDKANLFRQESCEFIPQMEEPIVAKAEPESYDDIFSPVDAFQPFYAEVKSKLYLELPVEITSFKGKSRNKGGKVVYIREDLTGRTWPFYYPENSCVSALCLNWSNFCQEHDINLGDKCEFKSEEVNPCIVRVVIHRSGDSYLLK